MITNPTPPPGYSAALIAKLHFLQMPRRPDASPDMHAAFCRALAQATPIFWSRDAVPQPLPTHLPEHVTTHWSRYPARSGFLWFELPVRSTDTPELPDIAGLLWSVEPPSAGTDWLIGLGPLSHNRLLSWFGRTVRLGERIAVWWGKHETEYEGRAMSFVEALFELCVSSLAEQVAVATAFAPNQAARKQATRLGYPPTDILVVRGQGAPR